MNRIKRLFRRTTKVAVAPPPSANGNGARQERMTTGEYDARVAVEEDAADAAMETCDAAVSAVRARRASGGHATVKR